MVPPNEPGSEAVPEALPIELAILHPKYHTKTFKIFETLHSSAMFRGGGIGLPLVKKAVEKMEGAIGVESEVGRGSRFWLALKPVPRDRPMTGDATTALLLRAEAKTLG
jgi:hypothetical protein